MNENDPLEKIMQVLGTDDPEEAVQRVVRLKAAQAQLGEMLSGLSVVSVVMTGGKPLFLQMPPTVLQHENPPEALEVVRDALLDASTSLRPAIAWSRHLKQEMQQHDEPRSGGDPG